MSHVTQHTLMTTHTHTHPAEGTVGGWVLEGRSVLVTKISHMMQEV